jgi:aspartate/methionine/tyrosine aminotransferase
MSDTNITPFELERYFSQYEFKIKHLLSCSDCEPLSVKELLEYADDASLALWETTTLAYTESQGNPILLNEIAKLYSSITPDQILSVVPEEGIYITMRALLSKGDHVVCASPSYQSLYQVAIAQGATVTPWEIKYDNGWRFDVDSLEELVNDKTAMIVINFPHNPTGATLTKADFARVVDIAQKHNCILFSDEMYRYLEFDERDRLPAVCECYDNAISLSGLSKSFAMPGARCGWLATKSTQLLAKLQAYKDYTTICASATGEAISIIGLRQKHRILKRNLDIIHANITVLEKFQQKYRHQIFFEMPKVGSICLPVFSKEIDVNDVAQKLLDDINLMLLPARVYGFDANAFRLGFARSDFAENLVLFEQWFDQYVSK